MRVSIPSAPILMYLWSHIRGDLYKQGQLECVSMTRRKVTCFIQLSLNISICSYIFFVMFMCHGG